MKCSRTAFYSGFWLLTPVLYDMEIDQMPAHPAANSEKSPKQPLFRKAKARIKAFYHKYEKYTELAIFGVGFIWDSLTMTRVDNVIDHIILLFYLTLIGVLIALIVRSQGGTVFPKWVQKIEPRFTWVMQFCFGGLFSSFVIFYFKSASWSRTQFFFLLLLGLWIGNEFLQHRMRNPVLLSVLYCFCLFSFFAFFLPVVLAAVNAWIFVLAGIISLLAGLFVFSIGLRFGANEWRRMMKQIIPWMSAAGGDPQEYQKAASRMKPIIYGMIGTFLIVNVLYFANLIPPVPLALKSAGIYHEVKRIQKGNEVIFEAAYVKPSLWRFWRKWDDPFYLSPGESFYCFTAIFAPHGVHVTLKHVWSRKTDKGWKQTDSIPFQIAGGRENGYRFYSQKSTIMPGKWRVEVMTERGQTLGRLDFTAVVSLTPRPPMQSKTIR
jgi:hypothetical protein